MSKTIIFEKRQVFLFVFALTFVAFIGAVIAFGSTDPALFGHDGGELRIYVRNSSGQNNYKNIQSAIDNNDTIGGFWQLGSGAGDIRYLGGNVGIGTTNPSKGRLHVLGDIVAGNDLNGQRFIIHTRSAQGSDFMQITGEDSVGNWNWTNGLVFVRSNGNVGIGTTSPGQRLEVIGAIHATGDVCTDLSGGKCLSSGGDGDNLGNHLATQSLNLDGNEIINIGGVPGVKLNQLGIASQRVGGSQIQLDDGVVIWSGNPWIPRIYLDSSGNFGINTTSPTALLHVKGEAQISGVSGDGAGKVVCVKLDGNLGTCNSAVSTSGTCTCA